MDGARERPGEQERTTAGEYALGALGGLLVLVLLGFLTYQAIAVRGSEPELSVTVTGVEPRGDGWAVDFRVENHGGRTAEQLEVSGSLSRDGREVEEASTTIAYVPPESRRSGALLFAEDPRDGRLEVRPSGYASP
ncbi:TIGR02588 family protein [Blastococcus sp. SYSU DS0619]